MTVLEKIKIFIDEKILKKDTPKLLMAATDIYENSNQQINLTNIQNYIGQDKYTKNLAIMFARLKPLARRTLIGKLQAEQGINVIQTHGESPLVEGYISGNSFISLLRKNVPENKIWQTIVTENSCIDISARKKMKENKLSNLYYKVHVNDESFDEIYEFDEENEKYFRRVRSGNTVFFESASYASDERMSYVEEYAQPSTEKRAIDEYTRLTKLKFITNDGEHTVANVLKINPYIVTIEASIVNKDGQDIKRKTINKIFKSKKECIVGYRPEMILIEEKSNKPQMYRLLPEGLYIDNETFKPDFEGRYTFKKMTLAELEELDEEIPFGLSEDTKKILRNGPEVPEHIKKIYQAGIIQVNNKEKQ